MITKFQTKVYKAVSDIPIGKVITYGELAKKIGCKSAQAVGQALKVNPFAPDVPCHRVVAKDGSIGGYKGSMRPENCQEKRKLLESEGVLFDSNGKVLKEVT